MFIVRSAFWLALLVAILPSDPAEQARLYQTASYAMHRAATFCDRNRAVCNEADAHWAVFRQKLALAGRMATDLVNERLAGQKMPAQAQWQPQPQPQLLESSLGSSDTLRASDRAPEWRLPAKPRG